MKFLNVIAGRCETCCLLESFAKSAGLELPEEVVAPDEGHSVGRNIGAETHASNSDIHLEIVVVLTNEYALRMGY